MNMFIIYEHVLKKKEQETAFVYHASQCGFPNQCGLTRAILAHRPRNRGTLGLEDEFVRDEVVSEVDGGGDAGGECIMANTATQPHNPKIYHIVHVDRLPSIVGDGHLWCDAEISRRTRPGSTIGIEDIKKRRLHLPLSSHHGLCVGDCVPFYFCPRSVMLYLIYQKNPNLSYRDGQEPIVHLVADLRQTVTWAKQHEQRWAFTLSNAGSFHFEDRGNLAQLDQINWNAVQTNDWQRREHKEGKQAEFLIEREFPWERISVIGVFSRQIQDQVTTALEAAAHVPDIQIMREWYY